MQRILQSEMFHVSDPSAAGEVRRAAVALAASLGFDETDQGGVAIVAAEIAKNIATHAKSGDVLLRSACRDGVEGVELLALDKGPGMSDFGRCLRDGYSTAGTTGIGLGAIRRMSSVFDVYSNAETGTALLSRIFPRSGAQASAPSNGRSIDWGIVQVPKIGEQICGDAGAVASTGLGTAFMIADGLGHGPMAHQAAAEAVRIFVANAHAEIDLVRLMGLLDAALRPTRGAAVSIVSWDPITDEARFAGVGNVSATMISNGATRSMATHNGTVGHAMRKVQTFTYPWPADGVLVMCSDGLGTQWQIGKYPGLAQRHPALLAGVLFRDFNRGRDDVTVLAARAAAPAAAVGATS